MYLPDGFGLSPHMAGLAETYQVLYMIGVLMIVEVSGGPNVMDRKTVPYMSPAVKALPILLPYHYEPYSFPPSATVRGRTSYPGIDLGPGYVKMAQEYIAKSADAVVTSTG